MSKSITVIAHIQGEINVTHLLILLMAPKEVLHHKMMS